MTNPTDNHGEQVEYKAVCIPCRQDRHGNCIGTDIPPERYEMPCQCDCVLPDHVIVGDAHTHETADVEIGDLYYVRAMSESIVEEVAVTEFTLAPQPPTNHGAPSLQPLRELAAEWQQRATKWHDEYLDSNGEYKFASGRDVGIDETIAAFTTALDNLEACDCTSGREHVHVE